MAILIELFNYYTMTLSSWIYNSIVCKTGINFDHCYPNSSRGFSLTVEV